VFPRKYCGRSFDEVDLQHIRQRIADAPDASRCELSRAVCQQLEWSKADGGLKEVSCRVAMLRMEADGLLTLPPRRRPRPPRYRRACDTPSAEPPPTQCLSLSELGELRFEMVGREQSRLWNETIDRYHYLGYAPLVGAQMRYLVYGGERLVALLGYGASAWRLGPRDRWIGWTESQREAGLGYVVGQARFLIVPWIRCANLASRILSQSSTRLPGDWCKRYGARPLLLETFVECSRFVGTSYRAANWLDVGTTQGRGKKDRRGPGVPRKQIYLYPLAPDCRQQLCNPKPTE